MSFADKIYCINLDRRPDRWALVKDQFTKHGLEVERFSAIDALRTGVTPIEAFTVSHWWLVNQAARNEYASVMIFEDDVVLHENFCELLQICMQNLPDDWAILYLGGTHRQKPIPVNDHILKLWHTLTTHAYLLRSEMYRTVAERLGKANEPADCVYAALQKEFPCYVTNPPLAWQRSGFSDIEGREMHYPWLQTNEQ